MAASSILILQLAVLSLCTLLLVIWFIYTFPITFNSAPFVPSGYHDLKQQFKQIDMTGKHFVDVGSGDGRALLAAAANDADKVTGIEINPFLTLFCRLVLLINQVPNYSISNSNLFNHDYSQYQIIFTYLLPPTMAKLAKIIPEQVEPGTVWITNTFKVPGYTPVREIGKFKIYEF